MSVISLFLTVLLVLMICVSGWRAVPVSAQIRVHTKAESKPTRSQNTKESPQEQADRQKEEEAQRVAEFLKLPPAERVRLWLKTTDWDFGFHHALIVEGQETIPYLANLLRSGGATERKRALKLLCEMDRFVANEELLLPEAGNDVYVKPLKKGGRLNWFMIVDGRRIGNVGRDAVMWAAEQTQHDHLRFHARYSSGLLTEDLRKLSLDEQLREWRKAVIASKGSEGLFSNFKAHTMMIELHKLLATQAPESLPPLIEMLEHDPNGYVREAAINVLNLTDRHRMRLRATEVGRRAIAAIRLALKRGGLKPYLGSQEDRESMWKRFSAWVFNDEIEYHHFSNWAAVGLAFERFYGEQTIHRFYTVQEIISPKAELRPFVTYLTNIDPFFPSWEYISFGFLSQDEVLHPRFRAKMARYHEYWKRFKAEQSSAKQ